MAKKTLEEQIVADEQVAQAEADAKAKAEADAKMKAEADAKAKAEADAKAKAEADAKMKAEADAKAKAGTKDKECQKAREGRAKELFKSYPNKKEVYFTSDSTAFFGLCDATNHANTLKDTTVTKIER